ncbi:hypothetical protein [Nocardioides humi]|uniref:Peptidase inhibitor family I36 n=1 Tax=Nocardioides humi TaxID=449461 RepID=A0ABN2A9V9_9ACTN|nr:hypothetical protein [Nocardioides humi]
MDKTKRTILAAGVAVLALGATVLPGGPAARAETGAEATARAGAPDEACILRAATGEMRCYPSADALLEAVTGRPVSGRTTADLAEPATIASIEAGLERQARSERVAGRPTAALASVVTAIFYDGTFGTGASLVMEAPSGCDDDPGVEWAWSTLTPAWRNRIHSGTGYSKCDFKVWDQAGYAGASYGWVSGSGSFGAMGGRAESVKMR